MKRIITLLLLLPLFAVADDAQQMSLPELRRAVLASNPSVKESLQRIVAAEAVLKQARSSYLPTVTLTSRYSAIDMSLHPDVDPYSRYADSFTQYGGGIEAGWLIFDGFARRAYNLAAEHNLESNRAMANETKRLLVLSATLAFRQAQLAKENMMIAERDYAFNQNLYGDAEKRFIAGAAPETDVHNFSIRSLQAESAFLQAQLNYETACTVLAQLMASPETKLQDEQRPEAITFSEPNTRPNLEAELLFALNNRPDLKALNAGVLALSEQAKATKRGLTPQFMLVGGANYFETEGLATVSSHGNYDSFVGVAAQWDLFTGGRKLYAARQLEAEQGALNEQRETLRLSIRSTIQQRIDEADTARSIYERQKKVYDLTVKVRNSIEKSYKAGAATITRLNEAQTDLIRAQAARSTSFIAYLLSMNQLDIDTGRILTEL